MKNSELNNRIAKESASFLIYINNAFIFGAEDLEKIKKMYQSRQEERIIWPYISKVVLNKDMSLKVVISEKLLVVQEMYLSELDENVLDLVIESAIDERIRFPGRKLRNNSADTIDDYLLYL